MIKALDFPIAVISQTDNALLSAENPVRLFKKNVPNDNPNIKFGFTYLFLLLP
jgi:hypothetical protein